MRQAILTRPMHFEILDVDIPRVESREILIRVITCGICTGELHVWADRSIVDYPKRLGHEVVGEVVEVGPDVTEVKVGDIVSAINQHSGFAEFCKTPIESVACVPSNVLAEVAIGEPLACAVNATRRIVSSRPDGGDIVLVGCGFMGLLLLQCLKARSSSRIMAIDVRSEAIQRAQKLGADIVFNSSDDDVFEAIQQMTDGKGGDIVIEATGTQGGLDLCSNLVKIRGLLAIYGYHQGGFRQVNMQLWNWKGLDIVNAHERETSVYVQGMEEGLSLVSQGRVQIASLVTNRFRLERINEAFQVASSKVDGYVKGTIDVSFL